MRELIRSRQGDGPVIAAAHLDLEDAFLIGNPDDRPALPNRSAGYRLHDSDPVRAQDQRIDLARGVPSAQAGAAAVEEPNGAPTRHDRPVAGVDDELQKMPPKGPGLNAWPFVLLGSDPHPAM